MILDEPFVGLDPKATLTLKNIMHDMCREGNAIFFSTHVLDVAEKLCNKVAIIKEGRLIASGNIKELTKGESLEATFMRWFLMLRQIHKLTAIQLCNLFGFNEFRHTKDSKKKDRFMLLVLAWLVVIALIVVYVAMLSIGLAKMGMSEIIPIYLYMITSLVILVFSFFKAGSVIFQMKSFEILIARLYQKRQLLSVVF